MKKNIVLFLLFGIVFSNHAWAESRRSLFVSVLENPVVLSSVKEINKLVDYAKKAEVDTLFVQIYRSNQAWFPSVYADDQPYRKALQTVGKDPLALLIRRAHAEGIEVHAWLNLMSLSQNIDAPILKSYGKKILTRNTDRKIRLKDYKIDNQYFLEPGDPDVRKVMTAIVEEIVTTYGELDGIQFDYIRYPDTKPHYGYTDENIKRFREATGLKKIDDKSQVWQQWKRDNVTDLLKQLTAKVRMIHPGMQVSTTGCANYARAYHEAFQDWPMWINSGLVDFVTYMNYPDNLETFQKNIDEARTKVTDFSKLNIGIPAYKLTSQPDVFKDQFKACESSGARGCSVFFYGSLSESTVLKDFLIKPDQR